MSVPTVLSPDHLTTALAGMPAWSGDTSGLWRTVRRVGLGSLGDTIAGIAFVAEEFEEELGRSPDVAFEWRASRLSVGVGIAAGPTEMDLEFARRIDAHVDPTPYAQADPALRAAYDVTDRQFRRRKEGVD